jgi:hypothetical protein
MYFFFIPFVLQSRYQWFCEAFLKLLRFSIQVCHARCCCSGWFMELAFALQENPCCWFPKKVAVLRFCLYSLSISEMSGVGTLYARVRRVDRQSNSSALGSVRFQPTKNLLPSCGSTIRVSAFGLIFFVL